MAVSTLRGRILNPPAETAVDRQPSGRSGGTKPGQPRTRRTRRTRRAPGRRATRIAVAVVCAAAVLAGVAGPAASQTYEVRSGDSLSVIARDHGVTTTELASANGISDLHLIRVGQVLTIPGAEPVHYVVRPGDSVSVIAVRAGVPISRLIAANGIADPHLIRVGQKLVLPAGTSLAAVDPAAGYNALPGRLRANPERLQLIPSFERWADHYGVPRDLLMAMAYRESGWQKSVVSPAGAIGVGQLLPTTADWVARDLIKAELDPWVADDNIRMSARLLRWLIGYMGSEQAALAGYYQGPGSVAARGYYDDTQAYIDNVGQIRRRFRKA